MLLETNKGKSEATTTFSSNIWTHILEEAMSKRDLEESNIFVFGDKFVGKRALIKIINKELLQKGEFEEQKKILGYDETVAKYGLLDYTYLNVKKLFEQDADSIGKMNIWICNELISKEVFESIIKPDFILKSLCLIVLDLCRPWEIMENLKRWTNFIYDSFSNLLLKFPFEKQQELRDQMTEYLKLYEGVQFDEEGNFKKEPITEETLKLKLQLNLKEGVLKTNIGVPIVFVVNKSDVVMQTGERRRFEEDSEFILKHIRNLALTFGATVIYTSTKQNTNLNVLYEYILHRIYKFDFRHKPNLMDRDSYFVPAGYDSMPVLKNFDIQNELELLYEDRVPYIKPKNILKEEEEIVCEDVNSFLKRFLEKGPKATVTNQRRNLSEFVQEDNRATVANDDRTSSNKTENKDIDIKEYSSTGKVNFDIFKGKVSSIDVSSSKTTSTAYKLEAIKKNHERLLNNDKTADKNEKNEKYEKTRANVLQKLNQLRKDQK